MEPALIRDLGLGKETNFKYPWNPKTSPIICKQAQQKYGSGSNNQDFWVDLGGGKGYPGEKCHEYIFTKA